MSVLRAGEAALKLVPELGGAIASWTVGGRPVFRAENPAASVSREHACYPLFPYSNRVANRRFRFDGITYELPDLMNGWAIHGAAWRCPWVLDGHRMVLDYKGGELWPFAFQAEQIFELGERSLSVTLRLTNRHSAAAPAAIGLHPFFHRTEQTRLQLTARRVWMADENKIPTHAEPLPKAWDFSTERALDDLEIDHCLSEWDGQMRLVWPERGEALRMSASRNLCHLVFYCPKRQSFVAIEPVSNRTDGLNHMDDSTDHGMARLAPGEVLQGRIDMVLEPL